jgi:hypothetical protein
MCLELKTVCQQRLKNNTEAIASGAAFLIGTCGDIFFGRAGFGRGLYFYSDIVLRRCKPARAAKSLKIADVVSELNQKSRFDALHVVPVIMIVDDRVSFAGCRIAGPDGCYLNGNPRSRRGVTLSRVRTKRPGH